MALPQLAPNIHEPDHDAREAARLEALARYDLLDTPNEPMFDHIARLIQNIFDVPIALVTLIDGHRQWYKAGFGLSGSELALPDTFCRHVLADSSALVIPDATRDLRVAGNSMVTGAPHIRFYAGTPLQTPEGHTVGTVCAIDTKPREFTPKQQEILADLSRLAMDTMELRRLASIDHLTGSLTRRSFLEAGRSIFKLAARHRDPLACICIDLDHFKSINDTYGHATGDAVLKAVAQACRDNLRETDLFARLGGEEFVALLPRADEASARAKAESLRATIEGLEIPYGRRTIGVTASLGVAGWEPAVTELEGLLERADAALYQAKASGRNRSAVYPLTPRLVRPDAPAPKAPPSVRRRVLKAGRLRFNHDNFTVDCTVRTFGDDGAGLDVANTRDLPNTFDLIIPADAMTRACKVISRNERHLEVAFV